MKRIFMTAVAATLTACSILPGVRPPQTIGEKDSGFTYIPLDPLPVLVSQCAVGFRPKTIPDSLPDNTVRIVVKEYDTGGKLSYGPASIGVKGKRYQVVLDYINVDTGNIWFWINETESKQEVTRLDKPLSQEEFEQRTSRSTQPNSKPLGKYYYTGVPVYIGIGLRLTADLQVIKGNIKLSSLGAIAADVEAGNASGSLVVQTLGVTGKQVSTSLPLPSELNQTTVQNAILSLGAIKAIIYNDKDVVITPRVAGMYLPIEISTKSLNMIMAELASKPIPWAQPCEKVTQ